MINYVMLAISVSIDALGIGISYGIRNSYIKMRFNFLIAGIVFFMCFLGLSIGNLLTLFLSDVILKIIGSLILFILGIFIISKELKKMIKEKSNKTKEVKSKTKEEIKIAEVIYLAMCISIDAMTAGISASLIGIRSIFFPCLVMVCHMVFLILGMFLGKNVNGISNIPQNIWSIISGILLVIISIGKLFLN